MADVTMTRLWCKALLSYLVHSFSRQQLLLFGNQAEPQGGTRLVCSLDLSESSAWTELKVLTWGDQMEGSSADITSVTLF